MDGKTGNKAFVLHPDGSFAFEDRQIPTLQSDRDIIVQIAATGLCGSDVRLISGHTIMTCPLAPCMIVTTRLATQVHYWQHGAIGRYVVEKPIVLGHESSGIVVECGKNVEGFVVGDRVVLEPGSSCNTCRHCRSGRYNLCQAMHFAATPPDDGTLTTYYCVPMECCYKLPRHVSLRDATLVEPLSVAVHGCLQAGSMQEKSVVVLGAGPVGLLCCAVARAFGASTVVAVDLVLSRLVSALEHGATHTYRMSAESPERNAIALTSAAGVETGCDIVLDATGAEPCVNCGIHALTQGGTFVQVGLGKPSLSMPVGQICDKEIVFKGSFRYGPGDFRLAIGLLNSRRVKLDGLITHEFSFEAAEDAFKNVASRTGIKSVIYGPGFDERVGKKSLE